MRGFCLSHTGLLVVNFTECVIKCISVHVTVTCLCAPKLFTFVKYIHARWLTVYVLKKYFAWKEAHNIDASTLARRTNVHNSPFWLSSPKIWGGMCPLCPGGSVAYVLWRWRKCLVYIQCLYMYLITATLHGGMILSQISVVMSHEIAFLVALLLVWMSVCNTQCWLKSMFVLKRFFQKVSTNFMANLLPFFSW